VSDPGSPGDAETTTSTSALVIVERAAGPAEGTRAETSARFVRIPASASTRDALRAIGAAVNFPLAANCASIAAMAGGPGSTEVAPVVELIDVGTVSLLANGRETHLVPRQVPDVTDVVNGVVYARAADLSLLPSSTRYVVRVSGGPEMNPFNVTATAPADPADVHFEGEDASGALSVEAGVAIDLTWTPDATDDLLYVDVQPAAFRCTLEDGPTFAAGGRASVPPSLIDDAGTLTVHRVHRESLAVRGLESGEVRFDFSRSVAYARR
jgi:hypothetical protein